MQGLAYWAHNPEVVGSNPTPENMVLSTSGLSQWVFSPPFGGSNPLSTIQSFPIFIKKSVVRLIKINHWKKIFLKSALPFQKIFSLKESKTFGKLQIGKSCHGEQIYDSFIRELDFFYSKKSNLLVIWSSGNSLACHARVSGSIPDMTVIFG